jgi:hypothetical protein
MTRHIIWRAYLYLDATLILSVIDWGLLCSFVYIGPSIEQNGRDQGAREQQWYVRIDYSI